MSAIEFKNVSEKYRIKFIEEGKVWWEEIWALEDIGLEVKKGEALGVIGKNGAGKTTLLKLIAGMLIPDKGNIKVEGKVSTLMELGAGFNPEFTGKENILLNARMYGLEENFVSSRLEEIIEFAGLGKFINAPVKYYSQGMFMRLGFALAIFVEPDILLIDDILAVGDREAQEKCIKKIFELKEKGKTIIVVSHDMEMIKKLCNRAILLDKGKIIKEGIPQEVISTYLERLDREKNLLCLSWMLVSGDLSIYADLDSRALRLYYKGKEISKGSGLHSSFLYEGSWYSIGNANWEVRKAGEELEVKLNWDLVEVSQFWRLGFEDKKLRWLVKHEGRERLEVLKFGIVFQSGYRRYFCGYEEGELPFEFKGWEDIELKENQAKYFGLRKEEELPAVVFQRCREEFSALIQNSDRTICARILQMKVREDLLDKREFEFRGEIIFLEEEDFIENYIKEERESLRLSRTLVSGDLSIYADLDSKAIRLYYKDRELTKGKGLYNSIYVDKRWFYLSEASWQVIKNSPNKLTLIFEFSEIPLSQVWDLNLIDENTLIFNVEIENIKEIFLKSMEIKLEFITQYEKWSTDLEEGDFSRDHFIHNISPVRFKNNKINKISLIADNKEFLPLNFAIISQKGEIIFYLCKKRNTESAIINEGNFTLIIPNKEQFLLPGKHKYCEGVIACGKDFEAPKLIKQVAEKIRYGRLEVIFESGKGRIFWEDKELTKGLSIFTSLRYWGIWRDSYQGIWQIINKDSTSILTSGEWPFIPVMQKWKLKLLGENFISWEIETEIYEEVDLEIDQANLMLSNEYKEWTVIDLIKGEFSEEFIADYDILPYRFWSGKAKQGIGVISKSLPGIFFRTNLNDQLTAIVENTDDLYQARLLQYQKSNIGKSLPKKYLFFKGIVEIKPHE